MYCMDKNCLQVFHKNCAYSLGCPERKMAIFTQNIERLRCTKINNDFGFEHSLTSCIFSYKNRHRYSEVSSIYTRKSMFPSTGNIVKSKETMRMFETQNNIIHYEYLFLTHISVYLNAIFTSAYEKLRKQNTAA